VIGRRRLPGEDKSPPVKIGVANNPVERCRSLQTGCPDELFIKAAWAIPTETLFDARRVECYLHERFGSKHSHGEWFYVNARDVWAAMPSAAIRCGMRSPWHTKHAPFRKMFETTVPILINRTATSGREVPSNDNAPFRTDVDLSASNVEPKKKSGPKPRARHDLVASLLSRRSRDAAVDEALAGMNTA